MKRLGVIFDMDGVIINSEPVYRSLNAEIFKHLGIEVKEQFQLEYIGVTKRRKWELLKERYQLQLSIEELLEIQRGIFSKAVWDYQSLLFPQVLPFLEKLKSKNIPMALASSSGRETVDKVLKHCGLTEFLKKTVSGDEVVNGKPAPEIFLTAAQKIEVIPEQCIVIEDSYNGLVAAKKADMYGIGVRHPGIKMDLSIADQIVNSLAEIGI